jgi:hypothetical protein
VGGALALLFAKRKAVVGRSDLGPSRSELQASRPHPERTGSARTGLQPTVAVASLSDDERWVLAFQRLIAIGAYIAAEDQASRETLSLTFSVI